MKALILVEKHKDIESKVYSEKVCKSLYKLFINVNDHKSYGIVVTAVDLIDLVYEAQKQLELFKSNLMFDGYIK